MIATALLTACWGLDPYAQIERDKARFPALSAARPIGTHCSEKDSASIKRGSHPLGPTGFWHGTSVVDYDRVLRPAASAGHDGASAMSVLMAHESLIAGYVRVSSEGVLRARTYDDVYGTAYGGWSPSSLAVRPTAQPVFVALGSSAYGDGGLSQVHEVCWTPNGAEEGVIVYSSAWAPRDPPLRNRQVFRTEELGVSGQTYNDQLTLRVLTEALQDRDLLAAIDIVGRAEVLLAALPDAVDGSTGSRIPSRLSRTREWADLLAVKLGLSVGEPDFAAIARELETIVAPRSANRFSFGAERYERLLPLYRWLDARVRGQAVELPEMSNLQRGPAGFDPVTIVRQLSGDSPDRYQGSPIRFWAGVKAYVEGDRHLAAAELKGWLAGPSPGPPAGFEMGAAARLLATQRANVGLLP